MRRYKALILTDHSAHTNENSLYALARKMKENQLCEQLDIATRANIANDAFFKQLKNVDISVSKVTDEFIFSEDGSAFSRDLRWSRVQDYDLIWLRLPPTKDIGFLKFMANDIRGPVIINNPNGIITTSSKAFLLRFPELCPPMKACRTIDEITEFKNRFPVVLKPFNEYGGKGIVKIDGDIVSTENKDIRYEEFIDSIRDTDIAYLGVKFLKNVKEGDKRIIVVNGKILGASLRMPPPDSWICNVAMGGSSMGAQPDKDEVEIIQRINEELIELGIVMYGIDTLVNDDGKRALSEINTSSIGGIPQTAEQTNKPLVEETVNLIWEYFVNNKSATDE